MFALHALHMLPALHALGALIFRAASTVRTLRKAFFAALYMLNEPTTVPAEPFPPVALFVKPMRRFTVRFDALLTRFRAS